MKYAALFFCLVVAWGALSGVAFSAETPRQDGEMVVSVMDGPGHVVSAAILREAYSKLGIPLRLETFPGLRGIREANLGKIDGDAGRIEGMEKDYPNLIRIPVPVFSFEGSFFAKKPGPDVDSPAVRKSLTAGMVRGTRYARQATEGMKRVFADNPASLFKLLEEGIADVVVFDRDAGELLVAKSYPNSGIVPVGKPVHTGELYHYLNKKRADLAPPLTRVLQEMSQSGESERIEQKAWEQMRAN